MSDSSQITIEDEGGDDVGPRAALKGSDSSWSATSDRFIITLTSPAPSILSAVQMVVSGATVVTLDVYASPDLQQPQVFSVSLET